MKSGFQTLTNAGGAALGFARLLVPSLRQTIWRGRVGDASVALTFDDGPHPIYTPQILEILRRHQTPATFFPLGRNVKRHPKLIQQMFAHGHTIGNHSWAHERLIFTSGERVRSEMVRTSQAIQRITGQRPRFFRPPRGLSGWRALELASHLGMQTVFWTISPGDWRRPPAGLIVRRVLAKAEDGAIVLLHDAKYDNPKEDRDQTVQALPEIIRGLRDLGYRLVTLTELAAHQRVEERRVASQ
jgi:peptidoglycan/xylan/chitin deacetylase (PgdA/CDA1 family)